MRVTGNVVELMISLFASSPFPIDYSFSVTSYKYTSMMEYFLCKAKLFSIHTSVSLMISPLLRHSFLLSSSTVFMFSIHTASTGPSNTYHFLSKLSLATPARISDAKIPSVLNFWLICTLYLYCLKYQVCKVVSAQLQQYKIKKKAF